MTNPNEAAFKQIGSDPIFGGISISSPGLTKREYFAAMAMQGLLADPNVTDLQFAGVSKSAVRYADALIAELNK